MTRQRKSASNRSCRRSRSLSPAPRPHARIPEDAPICTGEHECDTGAPTATLRLQYGWCVAQTFSQHDDCGVAAERPSSGLAIGLFVMDTPSDLIVALVAACAIATLASPVSVSGAVLLLPFRVSVLGTPSPAVTPTNLLYNIVATPCAVYRYWRQHQSGGVLTRVLLAGTIPGVVAGAIVRVERDFVTGASRLGSARLGNRPCSRSRRVHGCTPPASSP